MSEPGFEPRAAFRPLHLAAAHRGNRWLRSEALARDHKTQRWQKHDSNPGLPGFPACGRCHNSLHSASQRWSRLVHTDHRVPSAGFPLTVQHAECENTVTCEEPWRQDGWRCSHRMGAGAGGAGLALCSPLFTGRRRMLWPDSGTAFPGAALATTKLLCQGLQSPDAAGDGPWRDQESCYRQAG